MSKTFERLTTALSLGALAVVLTNSPLPRSKIDILSPTKIEDPQTYTQGLFGPDPVPPKIIQTGEHVFHVYITDIISDPGNYDDLRIALASATREDTYIFEITSPGGEVASMHAIVDSLHMTQAHTIANVHGLAASAAAMITVACNTVTMSEGSTLMFHNIQVGLDGDGKQQQKRLDEALRESDAYMTAELSNFLTPEELQTVINGGEVWLSKGDVDARSAHREETKKQQETASASKT